MTFRDPCGKRRLAVKSGGAGGGEDREAVRVRHLAEGANLPWCMRNPARALRLGDGLASHRNTHPAPVREPKIMHARQGGGRNAMDVDHDLYSGGGMPSGKLWKIERPRTAGWTPMRLHRPGTRAVQQTKSSMIGVGHHVTKLNIPARLVNRQPPFCARAAINCAASAFSRRDVAQSLIRIETRRGNGHITVMTMFSSHMRSRLRAGKLLNRR